MSVKQYNIVTRSCEALPRSKRLRTYGEGSRGGSAITLGGGDGHTHNNKSTLDAQSIDAEGYLYLKYKPEGSDDSLVTKIKAGFADNASALDNHDSSYFAKATELAEFKELFSSMFEFDSNNNAIKVKSSLYSVGSISAMGIGSGGSNSGGGVSYNRLDSWADYTSDKAGYVLSALLGYDLNTRLSSVEGDYATKDFVNNKLTSYATTDSVTAIQNTLTGQIGAVGARVDSNDEQIAILNETTSGHTTSIGTLTQRVDSVEQLAATKLDSSYFTQTNIKNTLGISDWALAATKPSYAWSEITSRPTALSQFTDDVVAGKYLSLSKFQVAEVANPSTVYLQSGIYRQSAGSHLALGTSGWSQFITLFAGGDNWAQMYFSYNGMLHYRVATFGDGNPENIPWKAIITEKNIGNYNAGSATKLQTPRKLWGNNFDGTADVSGQMYVGEDFFIEHSTTGRQLNIHPSWTILGYNNPMIGNPTYIDGRNVYIRYGNDEYASVFASNGNVGIGNTSPAERLDVSGNIKASGDITANKFRGYLRGDIIYDNGVDEGHFIGLGSNGVGVKGLLNYVYGNFPILFYTNGFERMRIGDYVGIGTTSPTERLDVSGNIKASGNINATSITINGVTITASNGSITVNGNVIATGSITAKKSA